MTLILPVPFLFVRISVYVLAVFWMFYFIYLCFILFICIFSILLSNCLFCLSVCVFLLVYLFAVYLIFFSSPLYPSLCLSHTLILPPSLSLRSSLSPFTSFSLYIFHPHSILSLVPSLSSSYPIRHLIIVSYLSLDESPVVHCLPLPSAIWHYRGTS